MTTLVMNTPAGSIEPRRNEILEAIDLLVDVFEKWQSDPSGPNVPTERFETALLYAAEVCSTGDMPATCREICMVTMPRLKEEWDQYVAGQRRSNDTPYPRFWAAFDALVISRKGAKPYKINIPPPVKQLLDVDKVSPEQIAWHIWGNNKKGPFVREDGIPDYALLRKEADNPGSVIKDGWVPPWEQERFNTWNNSTDRLITASNTLKEDAPDYTDPTPIIDLLRQGQLPAAIARMKKMQIDDVLSAAEKLGFKFPGNTPATPAEKMVETPPTSLNPPTPPINGGSQSPLSELLCDDPNPGQTLQSPVAGKPASAITPELRDKIVSLVSEDNGVPEITAALRKDGINVTQKQVQEVIAKAGG